MIHVVRFNRQNFIGIEDRRISVLVTDVTDVTDVMLVSDSSNEKFRFSYDEEMTKEFSSNYDFWDGEEIHRLYQSTQCNWILDLWMKSDSNEGAQEMVVL